MSATPGDSLVALVGCLGRATARVQAQRAQRAALLARCARSTRWPATCGGGLLVVDVLELHEGPVAGGQEAGLDRLAAAVRADASARGRRRAACPRWCGTGRSPGCGPGGRAPRCPSAGARPRSQVGALDRLAEGLVEHAPRRFLGRLSPPQQHQCERREEQDEARRRTRRRVVGASCRPPARPQLSARCRRWRERCGNQPDIVVAARGCRAGGAPAQAAEVIVVDGDHAVRRDDPFVPARSASDRPAAAGRAGRGRHRTRGVRGLDRARAAARGPARGPPGAAQPRRSRGRGYRRVAPLVRRSLPHLWRLRGARRDQLGYVVDSVEALALAGRLIASRMPWCSSSSTATAATGAGCPTRPPAISVSFQRQPDPLPVLPRPRAPAAPALDLQEGQSHPRRVRARREQAATGRAAPAARRDDGAGGAPIAPLHRLGVRLQLRRRMRRRG